MGSFALDICLSHHHVSQRWGSGPDSSQGFSRLEGRGRTCVHPELINSINKENSRKAGNAEGNRRGEKAGTENPAKPLPCSPPPSGTVSIRVKTLRFQLLPLSEAGGE